MKGSGCPFLSNVLLPFSRDRRFDRKGEQREPRDDEENDDRRMKGVNGDRKRKGHSDAREQCDDWRQDRRGRKEHNRMSSEEHEVWEEEDRTEKKRSGKMLINEETSLVSSLRGFHLKKTGSLCFSSPYYKVTCIIVVWKRHSCLYKI